MFFAQLSRRRRKDAGVGAERLPVHEAIPPERSGAEAAEQHARFQRPLPDAVDRSGDLRIVEPAGFAVGRREVAGADADAAEPFDPQDFVDVADGFAVFDLDDDERFPAGRFQIGVDGVAVVTVGAAHGESAFAAVRRIAARPDGGFGLPGVVDHWYDHRRRREVEHRLEQIRQIPRHPDERGAIGAAQRHHVMHGVDDRQRRVLHIEPDEIESAVGGQLGNRRVVRRDHDSGGGFAGRGFGEKFLQIVDLHDLLLLSQIL